MLKNYLIDCDDKCKHGYVYLIWKKPLGNTKEDAQLVCICSRQEFLNTRMDNLNNWAKTEDYPWKFFYEKIEIDHMFAGETMYNVNDDILQSMVQQITAINNYHEQQFESAKQEIIRLKELLK